MGVASDGRDLERLWFEWAWSPMGVARSRLDPFDWCFSSTTWKDKFLTIQREKPALLLEGGFKGVCHWSMRGS